MNPAIKEPPPRHEWHFDDVPEEQRWACYYYEFCRSNEKIAQDIVSRRLLTREVQDYLHKYHLAWLRTRSFQDRRQAGHLRFSFIPHLCPEFPRTPWQSIALKDRKRRLDDLPDLPKEIYRPIRMAELRGLANDPASDRFEEFLVFHHRPQEFAVIPLDWELSDAALKEIFSHYLKHRPPASTQRKAVGRRDSPLDGLHALGAMRLKKHYGNAATVMMAIHDGTVELPYSDESGVRAATRRAKDILTAL